MATALGARGSIVRAAQGGVGRAARGRGAPRGEARWHGAGGGGDSLEVVRGSRFDRIDRHFSIGARRLEQAGATPTFAARLRSSFAAPKPRPLPHELARRGATIDPARGVPAPALSPARDHATRPLTSRQVSL